MSETTRESNGMRPSRRDFMRASGVAVAAAAIARPQGAYAQETGPLRVGLIGCGGRGSGAAFQALKADPEAKLTALGDAFMDQVDKAVEKFMSSDVKDRIDVPKERRFDGFDNYKHVIDNCDVLVMAAPPVFRPRHLRYAVEAGKHIFCEKPVAVDPVGARSVLESVELARQKGLSLVSGLCYRYQFAKQATIKRIHDGAVGDILTMQTTYNTGGLWHKGKDPAWSEMEYQLRNWLYFDWLSGDHITEQHIHSLDKIAWAMADAPPVKATASGGRIQRTGAEYGNVYDHFNTVFEWSNGIKAFSSCRQWNGCSTDVSDHVFGTKGVAHIQTHAIDFHDGSTWAHEMDGPDDMYQNEHNALFASIRMGKPINDGVYMTSSTLMAIMGRLSAYTGKTVTWDEVMNSNLDLMPEKLEWGPAPQRPVAVPGETPWV